MAIRVLVVDDGPKTGEGYQRTIRRSAECDLVGAVGSSREALRLAMELHPDVVVASTSLQQPTAFELARFLKLRQPSLSVVLVTSEESDSELYEAIRVGVSAYIRRSLAPEDLLGVLEHAARGEYLIDDVVLNRAEVAAKVLRDFREISFRSDELEPLLAPLSGREIEILDLVARGQSNKQIARRLSISDQTVKNHISSILRKLAVNDRTQAVVFALRNGWIRIEQTSNSPVRS